MRQCLGRNDVDFDFGSRLSKRRIDGARTSHARFGGAARHRVGKRLRRSKAGGAGHRGEWRKRTR